MVKKTKKVAVKKIVKKIIKKAVKKAIKKVAVKKDEYLATLNIGGIDYKGAGKTAYEAVADIKAPMKAPKGLITLQKGKQKAERFLGSVQIKRFIRGKALNRLATAKLLNLILK